MIVKVNCDLSPPPGLSKNKLYLVLAISFFYDGRIDCRIASDGDGTPALYPLSGLKIVDGSIPAGWCAAPKRGGGIELSPIEWADQDFWVRFFDGDPNATEVFQRVVETLQ